MGHDDGQRHWLGGHRLLRGVLRPRRAHHCCPRPAHLRHGRVLRRYTTFSSFSLQTLNLLREGDMAQALLNIGLSLALCLVAVWLGAVAAGAFNQLRG